MKIPKMAIGTYKLSPKEAEEIVYHGVKIGYRHIDTANIYKNEEGIAKAIRRLLNDKIVTRPELFITSKVSPKDQGYEQCKQAVMKTLQTLEVDYLDLMLLHWPGTSKLQPSNPKNKENRIASVNALKDLKTQGLLKYCGVSNFNVYHFDGLPLVDVNQIEFHPLLYGDKETMNTIEYCNTNGIVLEAYSSLGQGDLLDEKRFPEFDRIARKHSATISQILLQYGMRMGFVVMPKSKNLGRLTENYNALQVKLDDEDIKVIQNVSISKGNKKYCWDPINVK
jgi:diketogulonate reductase-like aldo/keto reductase